MTSPFVVIPSLLQSDDIQELYKRIGDEPMTRGSTGVQGIRSELRTNWIMWLRRPEWQDLYDRLASAAHVAREVNPDLGDYPTKWTTGSEVQFSRYHPGEHYGWHTDARHDSSSDRVVSMTAALHHAGQGGGFEIRDEGVIKLDVGDVVVFPSTVEHRVQTVQRGYRDSLTLWLSRPDLEGTMTPWNPGTNRLSSCSRRGCDI